MSGSAISALISSLLTLSSASAGATEYVITPLNDWPDGTTNSAAHDVSPDGTVVGCGLVPHPNGAASHAVRGGADSAWTDLHPIDGGTSCAVAIDADGRVAVRVSDALGNRVWVVSDDRTLQLPSANQDALPMAFIAPDVLAGTITLSADEPRAVVWASQSLTWLDHPAALAWSIPFGGDTDALIVGAARPAAHCCSLPAAWIDGVFTWLPVLPSAVDGEATAASGSIIVGTIWDPEVNQPVAVRWVERDARWSVEALPTLDARSSALAVNASGVIVGQSGCTGHCGRAVRWDSVNGVVDLQTRLPASSPWILERAVAINDSGQIAVTGIDAFGERNAGLLTPLSACPHDLDENGDIGLGDLVRVLADWGTCLSCSADFNGSADVGVDDLLFVLSRWGPCAP